MPDPIRTIAISLGKATLCCHSCTPSENSREAAAGPRLARGVLSLAPGPLPSFHTDSRIRAFNSSCRGDQATRGSNSIGDQRRTSRGGSHAKYAVSPRFHGRPFSGRRCGYPWRPGCRSPSRRRRSLRCGSSGARSASRPDRSQSSCCTRKGSGTSATSMPRTSPAAKPIFAFQTAAWVVSRLDAGDSLTALAERALQVLRAVRARPDQADQRSQGQEGRHPRTRLERPLLLASIAAYVGLDHERDIDWVSNATGDLLEPFAAGEVDAFLGFPPEPQGLRARNVGRVILSTTWTGRGRSTCCCIVFGNRDFVRAHPVATKRYLRAVLKIADIYVPVGGMPQRQSAGFAATLCAQASDETPTVAASSALADALAPRSAWRGQALIEESSALIAEVPTTPS